MKFNASHGAEGLRISLEPEQFDGGSASAPSAGLSPRPFDQRRRNRHGRGFRGPLIPPALPGSRTRSEKFDDLVVDSAERMRTLWPTALATVEYLVEEVPEQLEAIIASGAQAPLGKYEQALPATPDTPATPPSIIIYRHPIEALCDTAPQVRELVHEVMVDQVAGLLNVDPDTVDPLFRRYRRR